MSQPNELFRDMLGGFVVTQQEVLVEWIEPRCATSALIVIDMQNDFLAGGSAPIPGTTDIVGAAELVRGFRAADRAIAHLIRLYPPGSSDVGPVRKAAIISGQHIVAPGTHGSEIADGVPGEASAAALDPATLLAGQPQHLGAREAVLYKPRWGAFYRTGLERMLEQWHVGTLVVAGCNLPNCPRATLFEASERDFRSVLVTDVGSRATPERVDDMEAIGMQLFFSERVLRSLHQ